MNENYVQRYYAIQSMYPAQRIESTVLSRGLLWGTNISCPGIRLVYLFPGF